MDQQVTLPKKAKHPGGRPIGAPTKMSRAKANELAARNETPLDVMIENMKFWRHKSRELTAAVDDQAKKIAELAVVTADDMKVFLQMLGEFNTIAANLVAARENSQRCAVDAAPYVHPKFTSIAFRGNDKYGLAMVAASMTHEENVAAYAEMLQLPPPDVVKLSAAAKS